MSEAEIAYSAADRAKSQAGRSNRDRGLPLPGCCHRAQNLTLRRCGRAVRKGLG